MAPSNLPRLTEDRLKRIIAEVSAYYHNEHARYLPQSVPMTAQWRVTVAPYFASHLLDTIRTVILAGARIPNPGFYSEAKALGFERFPEFRHMASFTYIDVIVFHERIVPRQLFHGLVHATQINALGLEQYVELYVRGFVKTGLWLSIPLEEHAFKLEARFAAPKPEIFSVDDEVRLWGKENRY
jgi:hypothetical protein